MRRRDEPKKVVHCQHETSVPGTLTLTSALSKLNEVFQGSVRGVERVGWLTVNDRRVHRRVHKDVDGTHVPKRRHLIRFSYAVPCAILSASESRSTSIHYPTLHIMPMHSTMLRAALLTSGLAVQSAYAYTQVNVPSPFMYKNIDPIVFPGEQDKSHLHSFFGSDAVTVSTKTSDELRAGCTNAENPNDLSVYWVPTLLSQSGNSWEPVPVARFSAYYGLGDTPAEIPIPENLSMLAGDAKATTLETMPAEAHAEWWCENDDASTPDVNGFPSKTCSTHLQQLLYFPNCEYS
jgi:hypothetical protein